MYEWDATGEGMMAGPGEDDMAADITENGIMEDTPGVPDIGNEMFIKKCPSFHVSRRCRMLVPVSNGGASPPDGGAGRPFSYAVWRSDGDMRALRLLSELIPPTAGACLPPGRESGRIKVGNQCFSPLHRETVLHLPVQRASAHQDPGEISAQTDLGGRPSHPAPSQPLLRLSSCPVSISSLLLFISAPCTGGVAVLGGCEVRRWPSGAPLGQLMIAGR